MTTYIIDMAKPIPGEDAHTRIVSEPVEFADLHDVFLAGCAELVREGYEGVPYWHARAIEDDGSERDLTQAEQAALIAQFEQAAGGLKAKFTRDDDEETPGFGA